MKKINYFILGLPLIIFLVYGRGAIPWIDIGITQGRTIIITSIIFLISFGIIYNNRLKLRKQTKLNKFTLLFCLVFLTIMSLSLLLGPTSYGVYKVTTILLWVIIPSLLISFNWNNKKIMYYLSSFILIGIITTLSLLLFSQTNFYGRYYFSDTNPIWIARMLGGASLISIILFINVKGIYRYMFIVLTITFIVAMLFTGSRGPVVSMGISIIIYLIISKKIYSKKFFALIVSLVPLIYFILSKLDPSVNVFQRFTDLNATLDSNNERLYLMKLGVQAFADSPILGQGVGRFPEYAYGVDQRLYPHNILIELLAELGFIGLGIFIVIIITSILNIRKIAKSNVENKNFILAFPSLFVFYFLNSLVSGDLTGNMEVFITFIILINIRQDIDRRNLLSKTA